LGRSATGKDKVGEFLYPKMVRFMKEGSTIMRRMVRGLKFILMAIFMWVSI